MVDQWRTARDILGVLGAGVAEAEVEDITWEKRDPETEDGVMGWRVGGPAGVEGVGPAGWKGCWRKAGRAAAAAAGGAVAVGGGTGAAMGGAGAAMVLVDGLVGGAGAAMRAKGGAIGGKSPKRESSAIESIDGT